MKLRTEIAIPKSEQKFNYSDDIVSIGSCFASSIGQELWNDGFHINSSLFGTIYNPESILNSILWAQGSLEVNPDHFVEDQGIFKSLDFHSDLRGLTQEEFNSNLEQVRAEANKALKEANTLILTFGSAIVHTFNNRIIANCQKQPKANFAQQTLSVSDIKKSIENIITAIPHIKNIILTVSPVRHISYGLQENNLSKALLRVASDEIARHHEHVTYFPAYEIVSDDLRDYRFYKEDLIHPSDQAIQYIYDLFLDAHLLPETHETLVKFRKIKNTISHRPNNPASQAHRELLTNLNTEIEALPEQVNKTPLEL